MSNSAQHKLSRIRKPRVHITYDLELGNATEKKEIPFVVGVLADLFGKTEPHGQFKDRKFILIDKGSFDLIMSKISPSVEIDVANKVKDPEGEKKNFKYTFLRMDDFKPDQLVMRDETLNRILLKKKNLLDLARKLDSNQKLQDLLLKISKDPEALKKLVS
ncbi:type VI secretion system contractile sheath small subunit [Pigmentibacter ruber]|nr:type VI secretion system contractile sheath small subunit [Pigmentibacter ruber]BFD31727.1 type VI secretion system contractile sheath small subunit [Pigmentibacter ruber]